MTDSSTITGFAPVVDSDCRVLILGTMPSVASLEAKGYYAHPRNAFWPVLYTLWEARDPGAFPERYAFALAHRVALWDVLASCQRKGSLDSAIRGGLPNDIPGLLRANPGIGRVFCNGAAAAALFRRHFPALGAVRLPSTSPASARLTFAEKIEAWRIIQEEA